MHVERDAGVAGRPAHGALQHGHEVERLAHGVAAAGEGQELTGQVARAPAGFFRPAKRVGGTDGQVATAAGHAQVAEHGG